MANAAGPGRAERKGDVEVVSYDFQTQSATRLALSKHLRADDHKSAALITLPGGRYLASYSKDAGDNCLPYRVSRKPGDAREWEAEKIFYTAGPTTYSNLCYLCEPNTILNFHRDFGRGFDPNYLVWHLGRNREFSYGGRLLTAPEGNTGHRDRPYARYVSNGVNRIHCITSDHHPRNLITNNIYHGYIEFSPPGYALYRSDRTRLEHLSAKGTSPYTASDFLPLFRGGTLSPTNGLRMTRAWPIDVELDSDGDPYVAFTARLSDNDMDHRFFYGRLKNGRWPLKNSRRQAATFMTPRTIIRAWERLTRMIPIAFSFPQTSIRTPEPAYPTTNRSRERLPIGALSGPGNQSQTFDGRQSETGHAARHAHLEHFAWMRGTFKE